MEEQTAKKSKKWTWQRIVNWTIIAILFILTCIFVVLYTIDQKKYTVAFLITIFIFGIWIVGYFMGHFIVYNKDSIKEGTKQVLKNYKGKEKETKFLEQEQIQPSVDNSKKNTINDEKIKRLEEEIKQLKEEEKK